MGLIALATMLGFVGNGFVGNGFHCFGSPASTGDIFPPGNEYVTAISVIVERPSNDVVGWVYLSNTKKTYVQIGKGGAIKQESATTAMQPWWHRLHCQFPPHYLAGDDV